jgi:hypothetical protein
VEWDDGTYLVVNPGSTTAASYDDLIVTPKLKD